MLESGTVSGSSDDLSVDISRCLRMRFSESGCRRCTDICPHGALAFDSGLAVQKDLCSGCLLCTAGCPVGALEESNDFSACLDQLSGVSDPVLGCIRTKERSNAIMACLGGLSEEHLLSLSHSLSGELTLNLSRCSSCINQPAISRLRQSLTTLSQSGILEGTLHIVLADSASDVRYRDKSIDRRSFFRSFRTVLLQSSAEMMSASEWQTPQNSPYGEKRLPGKRRVLNSIRKELSPEQEARLRRFFDSQATFHETCTACQACVAVCPTGALRTVRPDAHPEFDHTLCTGCGLCPEFCLDNAVQISPNLLNSALHS